MNYFIWTEKYRLFLYKKYRPQTWNMNNPEYNSTLVLGTLSFLYLGYMQTALIFSLYHQNDSTWLMDITGSLAELIFKDIQPLSLGENEVLGVF